MHHVIQTKFTYWQHVYTMYTTTYRPTHPEYNNNNNNTGHLLHAISQKSKEHIVCYKHITNYRYIVAKQIYTMYTQHTLCRPIINIHQA